MIFKHKKIKLVYKKKKNNNIIAFILLLIILSTIFLLVLLNKRVIPFVKSYSKIEVERVMRLIINNSMINSDISGNDFEKKIQLIKNSNDEIISIDFKSSLLNQVLYEFNNDINEKIYKLKNNDLIEEIIYFNNKDLIYNIPYGVINGESLLSRLGPKIPVKIIVNAQTNSSFKLELTEYGINNVLIKIILITDIKGKIILPFVSDEISITQTIPVVYKLIQGKIPSVYGGFYEKSISSIGNS